MEYRLCSNLQNGMASIRSRLSVYLLGLIGEQVLMREFPQQRAYIPHGVGCRQDRGGWVVLLPCEGNMSGMAWTMLT